MKLSVLWNVRWDIVDVISELVQGRIKQWENWAVASGPAHLLISCSYRAGGKEVDLRGPSIYQGGQNLKLCTKAAVFKRVSLLIGGPTPPPGASPELLDYELGIFLYFVAYLSSYHEKTIKAL